MKRIKYLTQAEVEKRAKHMIAQIGSCFAPVKNVYGTITKNDYGHKYNTADVSIMLYTDEFWQYWKIRAEREHVFFVLYADKAM